MVLVMVMMMMAGTTYPSAPACKPCVLNFPFPRGTPLPRTSQLWTFPIPRKRRGERG